MGLMDFLKGYRDSWEKDMYCYAKIFLQKPGVYVEKGWERMGLETGVDTNHTSGQRRFALFKEALSREKGVFLLGTTLLKGSLRKEEGSLEEKRPESG